MEVNGCEDILNMTVKERKSQKKRSGENMKPANIPKKDVATVWLNLVMRLLFSFGFTS